jgi:tetratricopeptide (TPR) repeat protein
MTLRPSLSRQLENPTLSRDRRAELRCQLAKELEERGEYEDARSAMGTLWQYIGDHPKVKDLETNTAAEVLLRAGVLTGWLGDKHQITNAQEIAKNLISESISLFESVNDSKKILEARSELAYCYWREGAYDEARVMLRDVISRLSIDSELKAKAVLRSAIVERGASQYGKALGILTSNAPLFEKIKNHTIKGGYHNALAMVFRNLGTIEKREDYIDRAFVEYTAASFHFEEAHHKCYSANVENNLGFLHFKAGRFKEAHRHLDRARYLLATLKDKGTIAQVDETRARIFLAQRNYAEAEKVARSAVRTFEKGDRQSLLAEALTTQGIALAHLDYSEQARTNFLRAIELAQQAGAPYKIAETELKKIDDRLAEHRKQAASLCEEMRQHEHDLIKQALLRTQGVLTQAAEILGISYQRLDYLIEHRHQDLLKVRTPKKERLKRK